MKITKSVAALSMALAGCATAPLLTDESADKNDASLALKQYCVVDLTKPHCLEWKDVLIPAVNADEAYKTTKLVLRRIDPGRYEYQTNKYITITKPFYIGVFELTQCQYELVCGKNPSEFRGACRPVENVSYCDLRGEHLGAEWPKSNNVDDESFIGKMRKLTGKPFDLPTSAQWELACRSAMTDMSFVPPTDILQQGKFAENGGKITRHSEVGSFRPNGNGLYDMFGNVFECCLDKTNGGEGAYLPWNEIDNPVNPRGVETGNMIVLRGEGYWGSIKHRRCQPTLPYRFDAKRRTATVGCRLCLNLEL